MMKYKLMILVFTILMFSSIPAQYNWQQTQGPYGGTFRDLKRYRDGSIFLSVDGGLYRSTDNASTWQKVNINYNYPQTIGDIYFHPSGRIFIFVQGWDGLFRSDTTGTKWETVYYMNGSLIGIDKKGNLYATAGQGGLEISRDLGYSWQDFKWGDKWISSFISIDDTHIIISSGQIVSITSDSGLTWDNVKLPISGGNSIRKLRMDSKKNIYAITDNELFCSHDMSKSWEKLSFPGLQTWSLYINTKDEIFISTQFDLFTTKDYGKTWSQTKFNDILLFVTEDINGDLYAGSFTRLYKKEASSAMWKNLDTKINNRRISSVLLDKNDLYIISSYQFYKSTDLGNTWIQPYQPKWGFYNLYQVDQKGRIFASMDGLLGYSTDKGNSWNNINISFNYDYIPNMAITTDDIIYASSNKGELYYTKDFGKTWTLIWKEANDYFQNVMTLSNNNELYFSFGKELHKFSIVANNVESVGTFEKGISSVAVSPLGIVYAVSAGVVYFMYGNNNWMEIENKQYGSANNISFTSNNEIILYNNSGFFVSGDLGKHFTLMPKPENAITPISFTHDNNGNYFLGTQESGLFKTTMWTFKVELPTQVIMYQNYPNPFNEQTSIQFSLPSTQNVSLKIYDILGKEIESIFDSSLPIGHYKFDWHPRIQASGVYLYQLRTESFVETKKMIFLK